MVKLGSTILFLMLLLVPFEARAAGRCDAGGEYAGAVANARSTIRSGCDCAGAASRNAYLSCARSVIAELSANGLLPRMCRSRVQQYASRSTCGRDDVLACCLKTGSGPWRPALRPSARGCVAPRGEACTSGFPHLEDACLPNSGCLVGPCGDGVVDVDTEQCEPPGTPSCDAQCRFIHACGNGVLDSYSGEECDGTPGCGSNCQFTNVCGNGTIEPGEECDSQPGCTAQCALGRAACCDLGGNGCFGGSEPTDFLAYWNVFKGCYILGGAGSYGTCEGDPCPPPAPPEIGCRTGSCTDGPIDPMPLCCDEPDGSCRDTTAITAGALGSFGCGLFPPPDQGSVPRLMLGSCGGNGRCVPAS